MIYEADEKPGWICPACQHEDVLIESTCVCRVNVDGAWPDDNSSFEWEEDSPASCAKCDWTGTAHDCAVAAQEKYPELA